MTNVVPVAVDAAEPASGLVAVGCFEGEEPEAAGLSGPLAEAAARLSRRPGWTGRDEQSVETAVGDRTLALYGLGKRREFTHRRLAKWFDDVADRARGMGVEDAAFVLPRHGETAGEAAAERVVRGLGLAGYRFDRYVSDAGSRPGRLARVAVVSPPGEESAYRAAVAGVQPVAEAVAFARDLANAPSNEATPEWMEERAREMAGAHGLRFSVLGAEELARRGMGGLLAVGSASEHAPRLVRLERGERGPLVALVGKGITFDAGGISIKSAAGMDEMKYDKCGACAVLGAARAAADLDLPVRLRVYAPLAENVLDARSFRPGDIVRCYNGKTVETVNTDAEGRLILADAMAWAAEEQPDAIVELSTLTGACILALGHHSAGLFTPDEGLAGELLDAAQRSGEKLWRLPMGPEYLEEMKGTHADLRNSATRWGAASTAAAFLSQFVGDVSRWAHLDIAGVAYIGRDQNGHPGATGFGIATLIAWLRALTAR
jgi:leucyl aminopeptidase